MFKNNFRKEEFIIKEYKTTKRWSMKINENLFKDYLKICEFLQKNFKKNSYGDNNISINYLIKYINEESEKYHKELVNCRNIAYGNCKKEIVIFVDGTEFDKFDNNCKQLNIKKSDAILFFITKIIIQKYNNIVGEKDSISIEPYNKNINTKDAIKCNFPEEILSYSLNKIDSNNTKALIDMNFSSQHTCVIRNFGDMENRYYIFQNIYKMRYIFNYAPKEIYNCFNRNHRSIQKWLKKLNWQFDRFEAQDKTVKRGFRDYSLITESRKKTQFKNTMIGSQDEEYIRQKINIILTSMFDDFDVIIGVNNTSILGDGRELDIPIILINTSTNEIYKFGIEVNGNYWHNDSKRTLDDTGKIKSFENKQYKIFSIITNGNTKNDEYYLNLDIKINKVCNDIKNILKN